MRYSNNTAILALFLCLLLIACQDTLTVSTDSTTPAMSHIKFRDLKDNNVSLILEGEGLQQIQSIDIQSTADDGIAQDKTTLENKDLQFFDMTGSGDVVMVPFAKDLAHLYETTLHFSLDIHFTDGSTKTVYHKVQLPKAQGATCTSTCTAVANKVISPFSQQLEFDDTLLAGLDHVEIIVHSKPNAFTPDLTYTYTRQYLMQHWHNTQTQHITIPVFGVYAAYENQITVIWHHHDNTSTAEHYAIQTPDEQRLQKFKAHLNYEATELPQTHYLLAKGLKGLFLHDIDGAKRFSFTKPLLRARHPTNSYRYL